VIWLPLRRRSCLCRPRSLRRWRNIVVPIYLRGSIIGEIDIDSHDPAAFTDADRTFLEEAARIVSSYIEQHP
jgi:GAF domain-containing protein